VDSRDNLEAEGQHIRTQLRLHDLDQIEIILPGVFSTLLQNAGKAPKYLKVS